MIAVSAKTRANIGRLTDYMSQLFDTEMAFGGGTVVSNARHLEALRNARQSLERVREGLLCGIPSDLLTRDIGDTLFHIGTITGEITTDDVLGSIFSKFCIGK